MYPRVKVLIEEISNLETELKEKTEELRKIQKNCRHIFVDDPLESFGRYYERCSECDFLKVKI